MGAAKDAMETLENNDPNDQPPVPSRWSGLGPRVASSVILIVSFLVILWAGGWLFTWLILMAALMMKHEWNGLTKNDNPLWRFGGLFYVTIPCASLIWLRNVSVEASPHAGMYLVLFLMLAVWATDIGAYFTGRQIGGPKLAPVISPNKTWAGLGGGVVASVVTCVLCQLFLPYQPFGLGVALLLGVLIAVIAQAGDLFESWMKRRVDVKDSGTLIPGHGGILDRIDGLTFTAPLFAWAVYLSN